jgi:hypothetical protein
LPRFVVFFAAVFLAGFAAARFVVVFLVVAFAAAARFVVLRGDLRVAVVARAAIDFRFVVVLALAALAGFLFAGALALAAVFVAFFITYLHVEASSPHR